MKLDAHQHFWRYSAAEYGWIDQAKQSLARDFLPSDLEPLLARSGFGGSIVVQARQAVEESHWLLSQSDRHASIKGVVGWVDLRAPEVGDQLRTLATHPKFVGVRHVVQDEPDVNFMLQPDFVRGMKLLKDFDLAYDLLIFPKQLAAAIELVRVLPEQAFVLDHIAKPDIKNHRVSPWREQIKELALQPNVFCKISGMVTEAEWQTWRVPDFTPYLEIVFEAFSEDRLMFGSDWPVCLLSAEYDRVLQLVTGFLGRQSKSASDKVLGGNAAKFYGIAETL